MILTKKEKQRKKLKELYEILIVSPQILPPHPELESFFLKIYLLSNISTTNLYILVPKN